MKDSVCSPRDRQIDYQETSVQQDLIPNSQLPSLVREKKKTTGHQPCRRRCGGAVPWGGCGVVVVTAVAVLGCSGHRSGASCLQTSLYSPLPLLTGRKYELIIRHFYNCRFIKTYISLIPTFHDALL